MLTIDCSGGILTKEMPDKAAKKVENTYQQPDVEFKFMANTITITMERYKELLEAESTLIALQDAGVDNWEWYGDAMSNVNDLDTCLDAFEAEDRVD